MRKLCPRGYTGSAHGLRDFLVEEQSTTEVQRQERSQEVQGHAMVFFFFFITLHGSLGQGSLKPEREARPYLGGQQLELGHTSYLLH